MVDDNRPFKDYIVPTDKEPHCSIVHPTVGVNNFQIKPSLVGMVQQNQFARLPIENPNLHLSIFIKFYGTLKINNIKRAAIQLRLFPFSL